MNDYIFSNQINNNLINNNNNNCENHTILNNENKNKENNIKNTNKSTSIKNKLKKNKYFIALIIVIIYLHYIFLFYSIFPLYEASSIYSNAKPLTGNIQNNETNLNSNLNKNNRNKKLEKIRNIENSINNYENDLEHFLFTQDKMLQAAKMLMNNKGFVYLTLFNVSYLLFLAAISRLSIMDPGKLETEYRSVFDVKQYCAFYYNFCKRKNCDAKQNDNNNNNNKRNKNEAYIENQNVQVTQEFNDDNCDKTNYYNNNNTNNNNNFTYNNNNIMLENLKLFLIAKTRDNNKMLKAEEKSNIF